MSGKDLLGIRVFTGCLAMSLLFPPLQLEVSHTEPHHLHVTAAPSGTQKAETRREQGVWRQLRRGRAGAGWVVQWRLRQALLRPHTSARALEDHNLFFSVPLAPLLLLPQPRVLLPGALLRLPQPHLLQLLLPPALLVL